MDTQMHCKLYAEHLKCQVTLHMDIDVNNFNKTAYLCTFDIPSTKVALGPFQK